MGKAQQHVLNAMGTIVLYGLGQGFDVDGGWFMELPEMTMGEAPNDITLGGWKIVITRTAKPEGSHTASTSTGSSSATTEHNTPPNIPTAETGGEG